MTRHIPHRRWHHLYRERPEPLSRRARRHSTCSAPPWRGTAIGPLVHYFDASISANQIDAMSDALAVALQQARYRAGDRIAIYLQNIPQVVIAVLAAWKCGAAVVPCNPMWRERELAKILSDSGARVLICQDDLYRDVGKAALPSSAVQHTITTSALDFLADDTAPPRVLAGSAARRMRTRADLVDLIVQHAGQAPNPIEIAGHDVAFMVYTSGTTGEPKAALNTHRNVVFATTVYERWIGLTSEDTILGLAPLFHVTGLVGHVTLSMLTGSPLVLFYRFDAEEACRLTQAHRATFTVSSVTAFIALLNHEAMAVFDLTSLTKVYTGGAPTPPGVLADWHRRTGTRIQPMYGLTEATSPTHMTPHGVVPPVDPTHRRDVDWRAGVQHRRARGHRSRHRRGARRDWRARDRRPADHPALLAGGPTRPRRRCATASSGPATSASWTKPAGSTWWTAPRT